MNPHASLQSPLAPEPVRFLGERFQKVEGERAAAGHRGRYAVVRQGSEVRGLIAVDGDLGIWYSPRAEDQAELRRRGFSHSPDNALAALYFDLPFASAPQPAAAPAPPAAMPPPLLHMPRAEEPVPAGRGSRTAGRHEIEAAVAAAG